MEMNCALISRDGLYANISAIQERLENRCRIAAVIKGDAYGHGIGEVAVALEKCPDVYMLVVSSLEEALLVSNRVIRKPILILNRIFPDAIKTALSRFDKEERRRLISQYIFSAYRLSDIGWLEKLSEQYGCRLNVHVRLDFSSGMRGMSRDMYKDFLGEWSRVEGALICGIYAHVYSAYTDSGAAERDIREYSQCFLALPDSLRRKLIVHLLSSVSYFCYPDAVFDMVRIGAALYGMPVEYVLGNSPPAEVRPVLSIYGTVVSCSDVGKGSRADYEGYLPDHVKRVALVSLGNWDIPGFFLNKLRGNEWGISGTYTSGEIKQDGNTCRHVRIRDHLCRIVGSPCMDTLCVDITGISSIMPKDRVWILNNEDGIRLTDWLSHSKLGFGDCQMLFSGMARLPKRLV